MPRGLIAIKSTNVRIAVAAGVLVAFAASSSTAAAPLAPPDQPDVAVMMGDSAFRQGTALVAKARWEDACRAFEQATRWNPDLTLAHYNLGVALAILGRSDEAMAAYREALRLAPALPEALVNLGVELSNRNRLDEALVFLLEAVKVAPRYAPARHNLGVVLGSLGRLDDAITALDRAAALAPDDPATRRARAETHYNLGVRHARHGRWIEALASYESALAHDREMPEVFNGAGVVLARLHRDRQAVPMFDEALRLRPSHVAARYNLARSLAVLGRYADAIDECHTALRARPTLRPAIELLDALRRMYAPASRRIGA